MTSQTFNKAFERADFGQSVFAHQWRSDSVASPSQLSFLVRICAATSRNSAGRDPVESQAEFAAGVPCGGESDT
ncbi:hypothetical protein NCAST_33_01960 [Nocardia asteroides NBRC 15531]|uniref:Uncharacterized protein n=1 Tax=Nocardia asteroides NBRC 15531 TaxID=1110697 RepID=U5E9N6_NOCAS|nr:hypothetical protein [Nocardia asteroides NBRC 15531]GAD86817.1 hypothetical protein NCAST_33_01960 [Nocardia asteroides NBRC 15531]